MEFFRKPGLGAAVEIKLSLLWQTCISKRERWEAHINMEKRDVIPGRPKHTQKATTWRRQCKGGSQSARLGLTTFQFEGKWVFSVRREGGRGSSLALLTTWPWHFLQPRWSWTCQHIQMVEDEKVLRDQSYSKRPLEKSESLQVSPKPLSYKWHLTIIKHQTQV